MFFNCYCWLMPLIFSDAKVQKKSHTFYDVGLILRDLFEITIRTRQPSQIGELIREADRDRQREW